MGDDRATGGDEPSAGPPARQPAPGRPRDPAIDRAILLAALDELDERGYARMTLEGVARRARTTRPALYRRWPGLAEIVSAALALRLGELDVPHTDCTICDLCDAIKIHVAAFQRVPPEAVASLLAETGGDATRRAALLSDLFDPPRKAVAAALARAVARGDLRHDLDHELMLDLLASIVHYRALFGHASTSDAEVERAVHVLLGGVAVDYDRLVTISRRKTGDPALHHRHGVS